MRKPATCSASFSFARRAVTAGKAVLTVLPQSVQREGYVLRALQGDPLHRRLKLPALQLTAAIAGLERLEGMMKTESGQKMARRRTDVLRAFAEEWKEEVGLSFQLS